jgi:hypothetical protein
VIGGGGRLGGGRRRGVGTRGGAARVGRSPLAVIDGWILQHARHCAAQHCAPRPSREFKTGSSRTLRSHAVSFPPDKQHNGDQPRPLCTGVAAVRAEHQSKISSSIRTRKIVVVLRKSHWAHHYGSAVPSLCCFRLGRFMLHGTQQRHIRTHIIYAQAIALALALKLQSFSIRATGIQKDGHTDACLALASLRDRTRPDQAAVNANGGTRRRSTSDAK